MFKKLDFTKTYTRDWGKQTANLFVADVVGTAIEATTVANISTIERWFPNVTGFMVDSLEVPVKYSQDSIEKVLNYTVNFEGEENYKKRMEKSRDERAHSYALKAFHYGTALGAGWASTVATERFVLSKINGAPHVPLKIYSYDGAMHLGLIALMSAPQVTPVVDKAKQVVRAVASTLGANEEKSEDIARLAVATGIPNYTVFGIVSKILYEHNKAEANKLVELGQKLGITTGSHLTK